MTAHRLWPTGLAALWLLSAPAAEAAKGGTFNMALRYAPQESVGSSSPNLPPDLLELPVRLVVEDRRAGADLAAIGDSTDDDDHVWPVRATNEVAAWAQEVLEKNAAGWGIRAAADAPRTLTLRLTRFHINESNKAVGSTYTADVKLGFALADGAGRVLAEGTAAGDATRYGKKRSADNANEVLSDATKEAYAALFGDPALQDAWRGKPQAGGGAAPAGPAVAPAALLDELVQLQKKGFTTDLLVSYVQGKNLSAPLSADDMVRWKDAGLPQEVIKAALDRAP